MLGTLFLAVVVLISTYRHSWFLPIFLGAITWLKVLLTSWLKLITPKLAIALVKNSIVIKIRDVLVKSLTEFAVYTHKPWRRRVIAIKTTLVELSLSVFRRYLASPLWVRCAIALALLALTASSTWAVLALLIIPQPIIEWLRLRAIAVMRKLGILKSIDAVWRSLIPGSLRERWDRYRRWTLGRRQVRASRDLHAKIGPVVKDNLERRVMPVLQRMPGAARKPDQNPDKDDPA